jgi:hypothetical protein
MYATANTFSCKINQWDTTNMTTPDIIYQLVKQFRKHRKTKSTDRTIDGLVHELYGLTEEEIKIVEG